MPISPDQTMQQAVEHHQAGRLAQAEALYRQVLLDYPRHPDALHLLGAIACQTGNNEAAVELIGQAIKGNPANPFFHNNLGSAYRALHKLDEAVLCYRQALALDPGYADAYSNLGRALADQGKLDEAIACHRQALTLNPDSAAVHYDLGTALQKQDQRTEAESSYRRALSIDPGHAEVLTNLGPLLVLQGKHDEAASCYQTALAVQPGLAETHFNLGVLLNKQGCLTEAEACYRKALALKPDIPDAYTNLGGVLHSQGKSDEAAAFFRQWLSAKPGDWYAAVFLAIHEFLRDDLEQAEKALEQARPYRDQYLDGEKSKDSLQSSLVYFSYLELLAGWWKQIGGFAPLQTDDGILHVIGESHALSVHNQVVSYRNRALRCKAEWIVGCQQWHLGNPRQNQYKRQFESFLAALPEGAGILLSFGEIDCRHNFGIIPAWKKNPGRLLEDMALDTAEHYLEYVTHQAARHGQNLIVSGVPATNDNLALLSPDEAARLTDLLQFYNRALKEKALARDLDFLDIFALTDNGEGISNGLWHLDHFHLTPKALAVAFENHLVNGSEPVAEK